MKRQQDDKREYQHHSRKMVGMRIFQGFDMIVDLDRHDPRHTRDVAANHENDAEFTYRVRKGQDGSGQKPGQGKRNGDGEKTVQA